MAPVGLAAHSQSFAPPPRHQGQTNSFLSVFTAAKYCPILKMEKRNKTPGLLRSRKIPQAAAEQSGRRAVVGVQVFESIPDPAAAAGMTDDDKPLAADRQSDLDGGNGLLHFGRCEQPVLSAWGNVATRQFHLASGVILSPPLIPPQMRKIR